MCPKLRDISCKHIDLNNSTSNIHTLAEIHGTLKQRVANQNKKVGILEEQIGKIGSLESLPLVILHTCLEPFSIFVHEINLTICNIPDYLPAVFNISNICLINLGALSFIAGTNGGRHSDIELCTCKNRNPQVKTSHYATSQTNI